VLVQAATRRIATMRVARAAGISPAAD